VLGVSRRQPRWVAGLGGISGWSLKLAVALLGRLLFTAQAPSRRLQTSGGGSGADSGGVVRLNGRGARGLAGGHVAGRRAVHGPMATGPMYPRLSRGDDLSGEVGAGLADGVNASRRAVHRAAAGTGRRGGVGTAGAADGGTGTVGRMPIEVGHAAQTLNELGAGPRRRHGRHRSAVGIGRPVDVAAAPPPFAARLQRVAVVAAASLLGTFTRRQGGRACAPVPRGPRRRTNTTDTTAIKILFRVSKPTVRTKVVRFVIGALRGARCRETVKLGAPLVACSGIMGEMEVATCREG
jgi:hypothetical protein